MHMYTKKFIDRMFLDAFVRRAEVNLERYTPAKLSKVKREARKKPKGAPPKKIRKKNISLKETSHSENETILEKDIVIISDDAVDCNVEVISDDEEVVGDVKVIGNVEVVSDVLVGNSKEILASEDVGASKDVGATEDVVTSEDVVASEDVFASKKGSAFEENIALEEYIAIKENTANNEVSALEIPEFIKESIKTPEKKPSSSPRKVKSTLKYKSSAKPISSTKSKSPLKPRSSAKTICLDEPSSSEPNHKKTKLNENKQNDQLKIINSREGETEQFNSQHLFNNNLNTNNDLDTSKRLSSPKPSNSKCNEYTETNSEKPLNSSSSLINKIRPRDIRKLIDESKYEGREEMWFGKRSTTNGTRSKGNSNNVPDLLPVIRGHSSLAEIVNLYKKYFSKAVQDTIVIIANILNIIVLSNKHHKSRIDESFKKRTEAEKLKERCDINRQHKRHTKVLESKLKMNFTGVVHSFEESDFETSFQMFFVSILNILRVLDQTKFKKDRIFKNLVLLLWNSLKNSDFEHPKVFTLLRSKSFRPNCINLISLIRDGKDEYKEIGTTDQLALFFVSNVKGCEYFQSVINAVTIDTHKDLAILIDIASIQCRFNSKFEDHIDYSPSATMNYVTHKTNRSPIRPIATSINTTVPSLITTVPSFITSVPSTIITTFPSTITTVPSIISTVPSIMASVPSFNPLVSSVIATTPSNSSMADKTAQQWMISKAPKISSFPVPKNKVPLSVEQISKKKPFKAGNNTSTFQRSDGSILNNRQYHTVRSPSGQIKTIPQNVNLLRKAPPLIAISSMCSAPNCTNKATIMCSICSSVKYCSHICQRSDWYDNHMNACEQIMEKRKRPNTQ